MGAVLIAGAGYVGTALGLALAARGRRVLALRRDATGLPPPLVPLARDLTGPQVPALPDEPVADVVYAVGPDGSTAEDYRRAYGRGLVALLGALGDRVDSRTRLVFVSSTSVLADADGGWVDEGAPTRDDPLSCELLSAERAALESGLCATVLRLSGIYGPGRTRLLEQVRRGEATWDPAHDHPTNRIHRDDCVGALLALLDAPDPPGLALGSDDAPVPRSELLHELARMLGAPPPRAAPMRAARRGGNKRVANTALKRAGWRPAYPSFREGYRALLGSAERP